MSSILLKEKVDKSEKQEPLPSLDQGTSYEVFRNNTTAVEVIVKDVLRGKKKSIDFSGLKFNRIQADIDKLHIKLDNTNEILAKTRKGFRTIVWEMKKLMAGFNTREAETQAANLALKLENEKLKLMLESKTKLVSQSKKELSVLKRVLKSTVKSICNAPEIPEIFERNSDTDYEDFESDLRSNTQTPLKPVKTPHKNDTFDTTFSFKEHCFERKE